MKKYIHSVLVCWVGYSLFAGTGISFGDQKKNGMPIENEPEMARKEQQLPAELVKQTIQTDALFKDEIGTRKSAPEKQQVEAEKAADGKSAPESAKPGRSSRPKKVPLPSFMPSEKIAPDHAVDFPTDI